MISGIWLYIAIYTFWRAWYFETRNESKMTEYVLDGLIVLQIGFGTAIIEGSVHNSVIYTVNILMLLFTYACAYSGLSRRTSAK